MKNIQKGFTLIELVVVITILGILAATAVPRFANLSSSANTAAANGILGGIYSAASLYIANNNGSTPTFAQIMDNLDCAVGGNSVQVTTDGTGTNNACGNTNDYTCATDPTNITVTYNTLTATGSISSGLCSG